MKVLNVENVADHPDVAQVGRWHWDEWGSVDPAGSVESWTNSLGAKAKRDRIPPTLLAYEEGRLVVGGIGETAD